MPKIWTVMRELLTKPAEGEHVRVDLMPEDLAKLVKGHRGRLSRVRFFVSLGVELVTEQNPVVEEIYRAYPVGGSVDVSVRQVVELCRDWAEFNERKAARGKPVGRVPVSRHGDCIFIG